jgi:hypothetical protein
MVAFDDGAQSLLGVLGLDDLRLQTVAGAAAGSIRFSPLEHLVYDDQQFARTSRYSYRLVLATAKPLVEPT